MSGVSWNSAEYTARVRRGAMAGVVRWIGLVEAHAVNLITSPPKSGKVYIRRGVEHQASAPGEAPASDQGNLVNNRRIDLFEQELRGRLTFSSDYALALEMGTKNMEPRPFAARSLEETKALGKAAVIEEVRAALK